MQKEEELAALKKLCEKYPSDAVDLILQKPFWHQQIKVDGDYERFEDDSRFGLVRVMFSHDSDVWITINSEVDPNDVQFSQRFRVPLIGGGESEYTRQALIILARAIQLDNEKRPQHRGQRKP